MKDAEGAGGKAVAVNREKRAKTEMTLNLNSTLAHFHLIFENKYDSRVIYSAKKCQKYQ